MCAPVTEKTAVRSGDVASPESSDGIKANLRTDTTLANRARHETENRYARAVNTRAKHRAEGTSRTSEVNEEIASRVEAVRAEGEVANHFVHIHQGPRHQHSAQRTKQGRNVKLSGFVWSSIPANRFGPKCGIWKVEPATTSNSTELTGCREDEPSCWRACPMCQT